jgi:hypothetical protein
MGGVHDRRVYSDSDIIIKNRELTGLSSGQWNGFFSGAHASIGSTSI